MDISVILLSLITMCLSLSRNSNDPLILTGEIIDVENYTIIGHHNYINGSKNEIHGYKSVIKSDFSIIRGSRNKIDGRCNTIFGDFNVILGERNLVAGSNNKICGLANGVTTQQLLASGRISHTHKNMQKSTEDNARSVKKKWGSWVAKSFSSI
ncbi:uncharacterized protein LOC111704607 isoform X3 [Eurytemora carolleeae]|uniref:uncharacterized protein LOC111704607 isoform X3 n=1 Tax=Eurytemora carolleeae TaxID=1294199 RepID=UPI000C77C826|nr:uncharacterized protein LOC111704607 isoform X3 [Eurytemora carolleeae]|eukprot:XP_023332663.1 uncharacterized protein LOC111704607 isoform X3 [Eurytemora affinis]